MKQQVGGGSQQGEGGRTAEKKKRGRKEISRYIKGGKERGNRETINILLLPPPPPPSPPTFPAFC